MKKELLILAILATIFIGCGDEVKEEAKKVVKETTKIVTPTIKKITKTIEEKAPTVTKVVKEKIELAKEKIHEATAPDKSGKSLYASCSSCHGADASKKALGKSASIKGWNKQQIADAISGYKNGTYGGAMKDLMKGQVMKLSDSDIDALSQYISNF